MGFSPWAQLPAPWAPPCSPSTLLRTGSAKRGGLRPCRDRALAPCASSARERGQPREASSCRPWVRGGRTSWLAFTSWFSSAPSAWRISGRPGSRQRGESAPSSRAWPAAWEAPGNVLVLFRQGEGRAREALQPAPRSPGPPSSCRQDAPGMPPRPGLGTQGAILHLAILQACLLASRVFAHASQKKSLHKANMGHVWACAASW